MPVRPRDAASLVLFRGPADQPHVLMGRRAQSLRFMPGFYVFPGGTVDATDLQASHALPLHGGTEDSLARHAAPGMYQSLVWAAVRETWEETGLFYGDPADWPLPDGGCAAAAAFHGAAVRPGTDRLEFFARMPSARKNRLSNRIGTSSGVTARAKNSSLSVPGRTAAPGMYQSLVWAAVRETWEETGLFYGDPADWPLPDGGCAAAAAFHGAAVRPGTDRLEFFARAVTPEEVPIRFDSRFFLADGMRAHGEIRSSGELEDVAWHRAEFVLATFPMAHITRFVLARALAIWCESAGQDRDHEPRDRSIARFTQRGDRFSMQEDAPGDPPQIDPEGLDWP